MLMGLVGSSKLRRPDLGDPGRGDGDRSEPISASESWKEDRYEGSDSALAATAADSSADIFPEDINMGVVLEEAESHRPP